MLFRSEEERSAGLQLPECLRFVIPVQPFVAEPDGDPDGDDDGVEDIEEPDVTGRRNTTAELDGFAGDAEEITGQDQEVKLHAAALRRPRLPRLEDIDRPGNAEADDHQQLKNIGQG